MFGWNGRILHVNLSKEKAVADKYDAKMAKNFLGGRGLPPRSFGMNSNLGWTHFRLKIDSSLLQDH